MTEKGEIVNPYVHEHASEPQPDFEKMQDEIGSLKSEISALKEWRSDVAYSVAHALLHHIDQMYPKMWEGVAKSARLSIKNTILRALELRCEYCSRPATKMSHDGCYFCYEHAFYGDMTMVTVMTARR